MSNGKVVAAKRIKPKILFVGLMSGRALRTGGGVSARITRLMVGAGKRLVVMEAFASSCKISLSDGFRCVVKRFDVAFDEGAVRRGLGLTSVCETQHVGIVHREVLQEDGSKRDTRSPRIQKKPAPARSMRS